MAKIKKTIRAGRLVKTVIYTAPEPRDTPRERAEKSRATTAAQKKMNDKSARSRLEMLLAANFNGRDLFITLTYRADALPAKRADAIKNVRYFLRCLRETRKMRGQSLKYIYTTENKHGSGRFHHHIVMSSTGDDLATIKSLWAYGDVVDMEYIAQRDYDTWAQYITKESAEERPVGAQMWTGSKGLNKPIVERCYVPNDTAIDTPTGCHIIEREEKITEFGRYFYIKYLLPRERDTNEFTPHFQGADAAFSLTCSKI